MTTAADFSEDMTEKPATIKWLANAISDLKAVLIETKTEVGKVANSVKNIETDLSKVKFDAISAKQMAKEASENVTEIQSDLLYLNHVNKT